jgi:uncharacterized protein (DUF2252 family)
MDIVEATRDFEAWQANQGPVVAKALAFKHAAMTQSPFTFLRATYYRWAQRFAIDCPHLAEAPRLLAIGDSHVENFGTWRDAEGRLVWGANDFDEAAKLPYLNDLVRLGLSAKLMLAEMPETSIAWESVCEELVEGYRDALSDAVDGVVPVNPIVLAESNGWLARIAAEQAQDPQSFWKDLEAELHEVWEDDRRLAAQIAAAALPEGCEPANWRVRVAGEGALGQPRYAMVARWHGGWIAREAKLLRLSAANWASATTTKDIRYAQIVGRARRSVDPTLQLAETGRQVWLVRRLAPDCRKIHGEKLRERMEDKLLHAMGHEVANIHLGQPKRCRVALNHLNGLGPHCEWLHEAVHACEAALKSDFDAWREYMHVEAQSKESALPSKGEESDE